MSYGDGIDWDFPLKSRLERVERAFGGLKPLPSAAPLKERKLKELEGLLVAAKLLEERITTVTNQLKILDGFPDEDPYENGTTLRFERNFPGGGKTYSYAATKANDVWYVTGERSPNGVRWVEFVNWLGLGLVGELEVVDAVPTVKTRTPRARKRT